jgi:hypothetical protein
MFKEVDFCGIYVSPFFVRLVIASILFLPLHWCGDRLALQKFVWNRPVFEAAAFLIVLSLVVLFFS